MKRHGLMLLAVLSVVVVIVGVRYLIADSDSATELNNRTSGGAGAPAAHTRIARVPTSTDIRVSPRAKAGPFRLPQRQPIESEFRTVLAQAENREGLAVYMLSELAIQCNLIEETIEKGGLHPSEDESAAAKLTLCGQLPRNYLEAPVVYLRSAAEAGVTEAQVAYPALASLELTHEEIMRDPQKAEQFKRDSMRYLHSAASAGSVDALNELAHSYNQGVITKRDPIAAYAYMEAVSRTGLVRSAHRVLQKWRAGLNAAQLQQAHVLSNRIHKECCT